MRQVYEDLEPFKILQELNLNDQENSNNISINICE